MRIDVGGYQLAVAHHASPAPKRSAILLHGLAGAKEEWDPVLPALLTDTNVYTVDLIGHGESDAPEDPAAYGFQPAADALLRLGDALGLEHPIWVGYSFGARLLLHMAVRHPGRVGGLVFESVHPGLTDETARRARAHQDEEDARLLETKGVDAFLEAWHARTIFDSRRRDPAAWLKEQDRKRQTNRPEALARCVRGLGLGAQESLWGELRKIGAPTLLMAGSMDREYAQRAREMVRRVSGARLEIVSDAGHGVHLERPEPFTHDLRRFLDALPVTAPLHPPGEPKHAPR